MPQPTPSDVHVNAPLSNVSLAYLQDMSEFVAGKVFPLLPVQKQSDKYFTYEKYAWFTSQTRKRAPSTESAGSGYELSTAQYFCDVNAVHKDVDDDVRANADSAIRVDSEATEWVTRDILLNKELDWSAQFFTTGIWKGSTTGTDVTPAPLWDAIGSTPIEDMRAELLAVKSKTGFRPNRIVMGEEVWNVLQDHPDFLERIKYTQTAIVTEDLLANVLGIEQILIGGALQATNTEGAADALSFILGKNVLLAYAPARPGLQTASAGYTFAWTSRVGNNGAGMRILRFRMNHLKSDRVEAEMTYDHHVVADDLGAFMTGVIS